MQRVLREMLLRKIEATILLDKKCNKNREGKGNTMAGWQQALHVGYNKAHARHRLLVVATVAMLVWLLL